MGLKSKIKKVQEKEKETVEAIEKEEVTTVEKEVQPTSTRYSKKIDKVYAKSTYGDTFFEVLEDGFNLTKEDKGYNTKVHFNFAQLEKSKKQKAFLQHYLDMKSFLYLRAMFLSGQAEMFAKAERDSLTEKKAYCAQLFSEFKPFENDGVAGSSTFSVAPGNKSGKWMVVLSQSLKGKTTRIQVPTDEKEMYAMLEFVYLAYQKHLMGAGK